MRQQEMQKCPICDRACKTKRIVFSPLFVHYDCANCGDFGMNEMTAQCMRSELIRVEAAAPAHLSAITRERTIRRLQPYFLLLKGIQNVQTTHAPGTTPVYVEELLANQWPRSIPERLDRILANFAELSTKAGGVVPVQEYAVAFAIDWDEAGFQIRALHEQGLITASLFGTGGSVVVTAEGWARIDELTRKKTKPENPVFVAMWFGDPKQKGSVEEMMQVFSDGIEAGVTAAGYRTTRVDLEEHNDYIMDRVIGAIRVAPFLIADYTQHRNGVYFEAGFAKGIRFRQSPLRHQTTQPHRLEQCRGASHTAAGSHSRQHRTWAIPVRDP